MTVLENEYLRAVISFLGGEVQSLRDRDGTEYIWQADPRYWPMHGPHLFPYIGRSGRNGALLGGRVYPMPLHGFLMHSQLEPVLLEKSRCCLRLCASKLTHSWYPYDFRLDLTVVLQENTLSVCFDICNRDLEPMYFALGGHPGFRVPFGPTGRFEDCVLTFAPGTTPSRVILSEEGYITGRQEPFPLQADALQLHHGLFDCDAVVLENTGAWVNILDPGNRKGIRMEYPGFPYLGLWHNPNTQAPFLCLEPWSVLPSDGRQLECLEEKTGMIRLEPGESLTMGWKIKVLLDTMPPYPTVPD